jgi:hypothetical protein
MRFFILFIINIGISIQLFAQSTTISIEIFTDNYPEETYWTLEDEDGNIIDQISAGDLICSNTYYNWVININDNTCYSFTIFDTYGDGICCSQGNGSYTLNHNNIIYTGGQFNNSEMISSICNPVLVGCIDYNASNYNALADTNIAYGGIIDPNIGFGGYYTGDQHLIFDSYVETRIVSAIIHTQYQCSATFELRDNSANVLDDTTIVVSPGGQRIYLNFDLPVGVNYELGISGNNPGIYRNTSGVSYPYDIGGLVSITGSSAGNGYYYFYYDIEIEAVCTGISSTIYGCTDPTACNYDTNANTDDGSCLSSYGCTDSNAFNYDALATCDDGTCLAVIYGCTDPTACNYDTNVNTDDGSCLSSYGCTDPNAFNYDALATCDDGTCVAVIYGCTDPTACNYDTIVNTDDSSCSYSNDTILNITACDSYTWIDGVYYTSSNNTATYLLSNLAGCDSIVYLDLTINQSTSDTLTVVTNSNYYWNGSLYTNSGFYSYSETNIYGCDSLLTLNLTVSEFSPAVSVSLSNIYCDSLADLTISVSQDSGEVDMGSSLFQSNLGSFDIASMTYGDTIGTAFLNAGGGSISLNTFIMVSYVVNSSQAIIVACDSLQGCLGTFTISNTAGGGVSIFANSVFDGNNYTSGNMSSITFENCFINPCGLLSFTTTINSEFGDTDIQIFDYILTSVTKVSDIESIDNDRVLIRVVDILSREEVVKTNKILFYLYSDGTVEKKIVIE